ncbi:MAG: sugar MFS transporter [Rhizomicrobium sp.]|jgi:FHS family L-fucose permease-like MFS transporter
MQNDRTAAQPQNYVLIGIVVFLFFAWGFATVLIDSLIPKLKGLFALSYTEVTLTQFSFFISYFVFSLPAAFILSRIGYIRGAVLGLGVTAVGCLLFAPASALGTFPPFLIALFVMAAGITMLQVTANPFIERLGPEATSHSRLTLAQAFNSLATTIGPLIGAATILSGGVILNTAGLSSDAIASLQRSQSYIIQFPFLVMGMILAGLAIVFWRMRRDSAPQVIPEAASLKGIAALLGRPRLTLGTIAIFVYVGAEVSIGSFLTNYLMQQSTLGLVAVRAGQMVSLYWGGAMIGRFIGAFVLQRLRPGYVLAACAIVAATLVTVSSLTTGPVAAYSLIAVGLFNSIMFPTIFALATEQLGTETPNGSGLLCMAIVGGALIPPLTGKVADAFGLATAFLVPAVCYLWILIYGIMTARGLGLTKSAN